MTEKLYDKDPYLSQCHAQVLRCDKAKEGWRTILDRTVFFARGGGQPCEKGTIGGIPVLDVWEEKGEIIHLLLEAVCLESVECKINMNMRLDHMCQHLGEHIFSAVLSRDYGAKLSILRIEEGSSHIEIDRILTPQQLEQAQEETRKIIAANLPVNIYTMTPQEASKILPAYKAMGHEVVRIVELPGLDINPCGGTHCKSTGEVGAFLLCGTKKIRGQFRIYFHCGERAILEERRRTIDLLTLQEAFDVEETDAFASKAAAVLTRKNQLEEQCALQKAALVDLDARLMVTEGKPLGDWLVISRVMEGDIKHIKEVTTRICLEHRAIVLAAVTQSAQVGILLARSKGKEGPDMGSLFRQLTETCGGKGGGSVILAQGTIPLEGLPAFEAMAAQMAERL